MVRHEGQVRPPLGRGHGCRHRSVPAVDRKVRDQLTVVQQSDDRHRSRHTGQRPVVVALTTAESGALAVDGKGRHQDGLDAVQSGRLAAVVGRLAQAPATRRQGCRTGVGRPVQLHIQSHDRKEDHSATLAKPIQEVERARLGTYRYVCCDSGSFGEPSKDVPGHLLRCRGQPCRGQRGPSREQAATPCGLLGFLRHYG